MRANSIKQTFDELVRDILKESVDSEADQLEDDNRAFLLYNDLLLQGRSAELYLKSLGKIVDIAAEDGTWSRRAIDEELMKSVQAVLVAEREKQTQVQQAEASRLLERFKEKAESWFVDIPIYGLNRDCEGLKFGRLTFASGTEESDGMFAQVEVKAVDQGAADQQATTVVDIHLSIMGALCSDGTPSVYSFSRTDQIRKKEKLHRFSRKDAKATTSFASTIVLRPISVQEISEFMKRRGGDQVSNLLANSANSSEDGDYGRKLLTSYVVAGHACSEPRPNFSFLLFAIALESLVLGKDTKQELIFNLATRVAHLLSGDLVDRKYIVDRVKDLYETRSQIVHTGKSEVANSELTRIREYCLSCFYVMTVSPSFTAMTKRKELELWFENQILSGPWHLDKG